MTGTYRYRVRRAQSSTRVGKLFMIEMKENIKWAREGEKCEEKIILKDKR